MDNFRAPCETDNASTQSVSTAPADRPIAYSVIVPFYNEAGIADDLCRRITKVMKQVGKPYELILVNDGSADGTGALLEAIARCDDHVTTLDLRRNFGQTTALQAGFDASVGSVIVSMDGDLQHDPYEIPMFLQKIDEGYDVVSGWRVRRGDNLLGRRIPSRIANWMLSKVSGVKLHDFGTTFKAYRREALDGVRLYGDMHRFVPAVCARLGAKICELPIKNVRRRAGKSNYGIDRTFRVAMDLITLRFMTAYLTRPLHFFGKWAMLAGTAGWGILGYGLVRKLLNWQFSLMVEHGPLMGVGCMLVIASMLLFATGLLGEMLMRVYFEAAENKTYAVRRVTRQEAAAGTKTVSSGVKP